MTIRARKNDDKELEDSLERLEEDHAAGAFDMWMLDELDKDWLDDENWLREEHEIFGGEKHEEDENKQIEK